MQIYIFIVLLLYFCGKGSIYCTKGSSEMPPDLVTRDYLFVLGLFRLRQLHIVQVWSTVRNKPKRLY